MFTIELLDSKGFQLASTEEHSLKSAKRTAREYIADPEYVRDAYKSQVCSESGEILADYFVDA